MYSEELNRAAQEIIDRHKKAQQADLEALAESVRLYPNGFEFSRNRGGDVDRFRVLSAFISGTDILDAQIFYRCKVLGWSSWSEHSTPISEMAITSFIKHFSQEI